MKSQNNKVKDAGKDISSFSRLDRYWQKRGFKQLYSKFRSPKPALKGTESVQELYELLISEYSFRGLEFGNWVNNEGRFNYLIAAIVAVQDIAKVLKFTNNKVGLNKVSLAFGARGTGSALAHFEPHTWVINLTRHSRNSRFGFSGGVGSLAHEYGHALDYFFGTFHAKNWQYRSLTKGRLTATTFDELPNEKTLQSIANKIIYTIIWKDYKKGTHTDYYTRLKKAKEGTDYWFRHNEIFARAFEQYINLRLKSMKITNAFLTEKKYESNTYLDQQLLKKVAPLFTKLIVKMRTTL
jgi:hypothetical protein